MQIGLDDEIIEEFRQDAAEVLAEAELALMAMDRGEDFLPNYNAVFRALHSIKGSAGMLGMDLLKKNVHHLETLLERTKDSGEMPTQIVDYLLKGVDATKEILVGNSPDFLLIDPLSNSPLPAQNLTQEPAIKDAPLSQTAVKATPCFSGDFSACKVLLYNENRVSQELIQSICEREGFSLRKPIDSREFFEFLGNSAANIIFCSFKTVNESSIALISKIKSINPIAPIIFISSSLSIEECRVGFLGGAHSMLRANCTESEVLSSLKSAYDKCQLADMVNRCVDLVLYQFSDLDDYLKEKGKEKIRKSLQADVTAIVESRKKVLENKPA